MAKRKKTVFNTLELRHFHGIGEGEKRQMVTTERTLVNATFAQQLQIEKRLKEISKSTEEVGLNFVSFRYFKCPQELMGDFYCSITLEEYKELLQGVMENGMFAIGYQEHFKKPDPVLRS